MSDRGGERDRPSARPAGADDDGGVGEDGLGEDGGGRGSRQLGEGGGEEGAEAAVPVDDGGGDEAGVVDSMTRRKRTMYAAEHHAWHELGRRRRRAGFSVPSTYEEIHHAKRRWSEDSWQMKALHFMNSDPVQKALIVLLLMDVLILFVELALDAFFPYCRTIVRDAISCCPAHHGADEAYSETQRFLAGGGGGGSHGLCEYPLAETDNLAGCDDHKYPGLHTAHLALFGTTIIILITFLSELLFMMYLLGPRKFCHQMVYVVDLTIVTASLVLELLFRFGSEKDAWALPGMLVIFRAWRFVRVGHGLVMSTFEVMEHNMHIAMGHIEALEERLEECGDEVPPRPEKLKESESLDLE